MKLRALKAREVISALERIGFILHHSTGSHRIYKHPATRRRAVLPYHGGQDLHPKVLRSILKQAGVAEAELKKLL